MTLPVDLENEISLVFSGITTEWSFPILVILIERSGELKWVHRWGEKVKGTSEESKTQAEQDGFSSIHWKSLDFILPNKQLLSLILVYLKLLLTQWWQWIEKQLENCTAERLTLGTNISNDLFLDNIWLSYLKSAVPHSKEYTMRACRSMPSFSCQVTEPLSWMLL